MGMGLISLKWGVEGWVPSSSLSSCRDPLGLHQNLEFSFLKVSGLFATDQLPPRESFTIHVNFCMWSMFVVNLKAKGLSWKISPGFLKLGRTLQVWQVKGGSNRTCKIKGAWLPSTSVLLDVKYMLFWYSDEYNNKYNVIYTEFFKLKYITLKIILATRGSCC